MDCLWHPHFLCVNYSSPTNTLLRESRPVCLSQIHSLPGKSAWIRDGTLKTAPPGAQCYAVRTANQKRYSHSGQELY